MENSKSCFTNDISLSKDSEQNADHGLRGSMISDQKSDVFKCYKVVRHLGQGSMGNIDCVELINANHRHLSSSRQQRNPLDHRVGKKEKFEYALKSIMLRRVTKMFLDELRNEIDILKSLDHPNIVKAYKTFETNKKIYIVMELCSGGDLYTKAPYSEWEAARIMTKILSAVSYMHSKNIVHRDLKFENIMFESASPDAEIKIIDFGLSTKFVSSSGKLSPNKLIMTEGVGTVYTMAPQVLQRAYTPKADLWSVGVIAYMLLSSTKPFWGKSRYIIIDKIMRCDYNFNGQNWNHVSKEAKDFVMSLIKMDPQERLDADQAAKSTWLNSEFPLADRRPDRNVMQSVHDNIISYADSADFKKLVLMFLAHQNPTTPEIIELRHAFDQYDSSNGGTITLSEFQLALADRNFLGAKVNDIFESLDIEKNGVIQYTEFIAANLEAQGGIEEGRLINAFDHFDVDHSGFISLHNLKQIVGRQYTEAMVREMFNDADLNKDGKIACEEFLEMFKYHSRKEFSPPDDIALLDENTIIA